MVYNLPLGIFLSFTTPRGRYRCFHYIIDEEAKTQFVTLPTSHRYQETEKGFRSPKSGALLTVWFTSLVWHWRPFDKPGFTASTTPPPFPS